MMPHSGLSLQPDRRRRAELAQRSDAGARPRHSGPHLEVAADGASRLQIFRYVTWPSVQALYFTCTIISMIWTLGDFNSVYLLTGGGPADLTHVLATLGIRYLRLDAVDLSMAAIICALPLVLPLVFIMMKRLSR
jgi:multiple sugar transport system permease protein